MRRTDGHIGADEREPLCHAVMVAVDGKCGHPQPAEQQRRRAGLRSDAAERLEPVAGVANGKVFQEVDLEPAVPPRRDLAQYRLNARRLLLGPGHRNDRRLDLAGVGVANGFPRRVSRAQRLECAPRVGVARAMRQQRRDELAQRIEVVEVRDRAAVLHAQTSVHLECLLPQGGVIARGALAQRARGHDLTRPSALACRSAGADPGAARRSDRSGRSRCDSVPSDVRRCR